MYRNTYYAGADAITHTGNTNAYGTLISAAQQALAVCSGNEALQVAISNKIATVGSNIRVIDAPLSLLTNTKRTVQSSPSSSGSIITNVLIDNMPASSTDTIENFDDEIKRLKSNLNYDLVSDVASGTWDSVQSLIDGSSGHVDGLQLIDGKLIYPGNVGSYPSDFRTTSIANGSTFNNGGTGGTGRNYGPAAGTRYYYRYFKQLAPTTGNFVIKIDGSGGTFVPVGTALTGNNIHVEIKAPTQTGWMDAYNDFVTATWTDGTGARNATGGAGRAFATNWGLTIGTKSTSSTAGYMIMRIAVGTSFTGNFDKITFTFA